MNDRFADLRKVPKEPAMRLMAAANVKMQSTLGIPANADVSSVLAALDGEEDPITAVLDMLRVMSASLPARERTWWACLAARDLLGPEPAKLPLTLQATEGWVRKPSDETRDAVRAALEIAEPDDETTLAATSAIFCDGKLGTGDLAQYDAPPGASQAAAFGMNVSALTVAGDGLEPAAQHLVDRALDLARGGNGKATGLWTFQPEEPAEDLEDEEEEPVT